MKKIEVVTLSKSIFSKIDDALKAKFLLESRDIEVSFAKNVFQKSDEFESIDIGSRLAALYEAYLDENVDYIIAAHGGYNSIELLPYLDYELIAKNYKPLIGYSDITIIQNAILSKCKDSVNNAFMPNGLNFLDFTYKAFDSKSIDGFINMIQSNSFQTFDSNYFYDVGKLTKRKTDKSLAVNSGKAFGRVIGGNLGSYFVLQGTQYYCGYDEDCILFIEEDQLVGKATLRESLRRIQSIFMLPNKIVGLVIGRFEYSSKVEIQSFLRGLSRIAETNSIPLVVNVSYGHTYPKYLVPLGGYCALDVGDNNEISIDFDVELLDKQEKETKWANSNQ